MYVRQLCRTRRPSPCAVEALENRALLASETPAYPADPTHLTTAGNLVYFVSAGTALWRTDGAAAGTVKLLSMTSRFQDGLWPVGNRVFLVNTTKAGTELWISAGTPQTTYLVKDIRRGAASSSPEFIGALGGRMLFLADDGLHGKELWISDGTKGGTHLVKDIKPGASTSSPKSLGMVNTRLIFTADDGLHGKELWCSDGTRAGTVLLRDITHAAGSTNPSHVTIVGNTLFFTKVRGRRKDVYGSEYTLYNLWRTDGTPAGTYRLASPCEIHSPVNLNGQLVFRDHNPDMSVYLWRSDGTIEGTVRYAELNQFIWWIPDRDVFLMSDYGLYVAGNKAYFVFDGEEGRGRGAALYATDGRTSWQVKSFASPQLADQIYLLDQLVDIGGSLWFNAYYYVPESGDIGVWTSDGTLENTRLVKRFAFGAEPTTVNLAGAPFIHNDGTLWSTDGTPGGTVQAADFPGGFFGPFANAGAYSVFVADDGVHGKEPWISDGTPGGIRMLKDIDVGADSSVGGSWLSYTIRGNKFYFVANDGLHGPEIWVWEYKSKKRPYPLMGEARPGFAYIALGDV